MMKLAVRHMSPRERENFRTAWVEHLVNAAINSGAKIPAKRTVVSVIDDSDSAGPPPKKAKNTAAADASGPEHTDHATGEYLPSFSSVPSTHSAIPTNLKETTFATFGWKQASPEAVKEQTKKVAEGKAKK
jgi:hypothetical protein